MALVSTMETLQAFTRRKTAMSTNTVLILGARGRFGLAAARAFALLVLASAVHAQTTFTQIGDTTFGSDGKTYQQIGNTTFGSDGSTYQRIGNTTFGSDGSTYQQSGNTGFGSNGVTTQRIGNTTFIQQPSGQQRTCQKIGTQIFCN